MKKAVICGAGLVGNLAACYLAKDGFTIEIYEKYADPRIRKPGCFRSINLTLGHRGESALEEIGLLDGVLKDSVPARGRVAWSSEGEVLSRINYGEKGESIHSISRFDTNLYLLDEAEKLPNVTIHFEHELVACDFDAGTATFSRNADANDIDNKDGNLTDIELVTVAGDLFIGADGAHSAMRAEMSKHKKLDKLEFKYHHHYYLELLVPSKNNDYQLEKDRLHVWPKDSFTLICLPNLDKTFSGTLVMPKHKFDNMLSSEEALVTFFRDELKKVYDMIGKENLIKQFHPGKQNAKTPCRLVDVKCEPYHAASSSGTKFVLLGDAAHAMVPFYGQGMNTGFEDVQQFYHSLQKHSCNSEGISMAIEEFSAHRCKDGQAMSEISYDHYQALCSSVKKSNYNVRRHIDSFLHRILGNDWIPEYTLVAFSSTPQSQCRAICKRQDKMLSFWFKMFCFAAILLISPLVLTLLTVAL